MTGFLYSTGASALFSGSIRWEKGPNYIYLMKHPWRPSSPDMISYSELTKHSDHSGQLDRCTIVTRPSDILFDASDYHSNQTVKSLDFQYGVVLCDDIPLGVFDAGNIYQVRDGNIHLVWDSNGIFRFSFGGAEAIDEAALERNLAAMKEDMDTWGLPATIPASSEGAMKLGR